MSRTVTSSTRTALTLQQAVAQAPTLARLSERFFVPVESER